MVRADLEKRPGDVAAMFDAVAGRYDLLNDVLSAGQVRLWRRAVARAVAARPGERVLDLAAGTGTSTATFAAAGAECVACDFSLGMLRAGLRRARAAQDRAATGRAVPDRPVAFVAGDALVRAAERGRHGAGAGRDAAGDPARRPTGHLRVLPADRPAAAGGLRAVPGPGAARDRPPRLPQPDGLRVPGRVDHGLAGPAGAGPAHARRRLVGRTVAGPEPRDRRHPRRPPCVRGGVTTGERAALLSA